MPFHVGTRRFFRVPPNTATQVDRPLQQHSAENMSCHVFTVGLNQTIFFQANPFGRTKKKRMARAFAFVASVAGRKRNTIDSGSRRMFLSRGWHSENTGKRTGRCDRWAFFAHGATSRTKIAENVGIQKRLIHSAKRVSTPQTHKEHVRQNVQIVATSKFRGEKI